MWSAHYVAFRSQRDPSKRQLAGIAKLIRCFGAAHGCYAGRTDMLGSAAMAGRGLHQMRPCQYGAGKYNEVLPMGHAESALRVGLSMGDQNAWISMGK